MTQLAITTTTDACAFQARDSMARLGIADTPQNFWIWHTYHAGANPDLNRAIDILLSNRREFTDETNEEIYERFLGTTRENEIIQETTQRVLTTLDALMRFIREVSLRTTSYKETLTGLSQEVVAGRPLTDLLDVLMNETRTIEQQSHLLQQRLASSSSLIGQLRRDLETVQRDALTDGLTGIANRKRFDTALRQAVMEVMETGNDLGLILIDIDHFKRFNDNFGHQTGDEVLQLLAKTLMETLRKADTPTRYGGEEFAAILPKAGAEEALAIAERLRRAVEAKTLKRRETGEDCGTITISVGLALFDPGESLASLIARADEALYAAKRGGRNRVAMASAVN